MLHSITVNPYLNQQDARGSGFHGQKFCIQRHPNTQSNFTIRLKPNSPFWYHYDLSSVWYGNLII